MSATEQQLQAAGSRSRWSELSGGAFLAMALGLIALCVAVVALYLPGNDSDSNRTTSAPVAASPAAASAPCPFAWIACAKSRMSPLSSKLNGCTR